MKMTALPLVEFKRNPRQVRAAAAVAFGVALVSAEAAARSNDETRTFTGVTQEIFDSCITPKKSNITSMGWAEYMRSQHDANQGDVQLKSYFLFYGNPGKLRFQFDPVAKTIKYEIVKGSLTVGVTPSRVWTGFESTMAQCVR